MELTTSIPVNFESTNNLLTADTWLRFLDTQPLISCDFETALRYTQSDLDHFQSIVDSPTSTNLERRAAQAKLRATALDHPSHTVITHLSVAWSSSDAYVFIIDSDKLLKRILHWLTHTQTRQIWHNASYDFRNLHYRTGKFPINYEDSQLLAKCILNHVETYKAKSGLKDLAGHWYGDWGISADNFSVSQMYEPHVLRYSAIDSCATFKLWQSMQSYLQETYHEPTYPTHASREFRDEHPEALL